MTTMEEELIIREIGRLLERMVVSRLDAIEKQLEDLRKRSDSMESGMREFRRSLGFSEPG